MAAANINLFLFLSILSLLFPTPTLCDNADSIAINWGRVANNLPSPPQVVQLLKTTGFTRVKIYDADPAVLSALAGTQISVTVCMPNENLSSAGIQSFTDSWVQSNIARYYPKTLIEAIAVGNEVFADPLNRTDLLVPAMKNVYASLQKYKLDNNIKVSTPLALGALGNSYPPSAGSFKSEYVPVMKSMLDFIRQSDSYLMVNVYPFFAYVSNSDKISLDYALFRDNAGQKDPTNGLVYKSLFEAQLDAVYAAVNALKYNDVKLVVTETGWPSKGDENEAGAALDNASAYNGGLVRRVLTEEGTPLRPNDTLTVYLFALFNENQKSGPSSERNYGLFYPNMQKVYDIPITVQDLRNGSKVVASAPSGSTVAAPGPAGGNTWCVARPGTEATKLQNGINWACGEGGVDCRAIQPDATCYNPNNLEMHASYAFNSYYQKNGRGSWTCDFGGAAQIVSKPPRYGNCKFSTGN